MLLNVKEFLKPTSVEQAFEMLNRDRKHSILLSGGTTVSLMKSTTVEVIIDLKNIKELAEIKETEDGLSVGANITIEDFRKSDLISTFFGNFFSKSFATVGSWQIRNMATIGGSVAPRLGWSDVTTCLLAAGAKLKTFGEEGYRYMDIEDFNKLDRYSKPIITHVILPKDGYLYSFKKLSKSSFDIAIVNFALALKLNSGIVESSRVVIGSRPHFPKRFEKVEEALKGLKIEEVPEHVKPLVFEHFEGGSNFLATEEYRRHMASVLAERAAKEIREMIA
ncbi:FAD binding domain-containing protein [Kosmotoga sp.]|uniref:FAD binding domain-containing protein n=1 Tax=Kosmotoga sp. TaxID=1955248 RepID=UPI002585091E|nr:FAD binding domain-containing protein [Kosmotoga sp.]